MYDQNIKNWLFFESQNDRITQRTEKSELQLFMFNLIFTNRKALITHEVYEVSPKVLDKIIQNYFALFKILY